MSLPNPNPGICFDCGCSLGQGAHWIQMRCAPCRKEWNCFQGKQCQARLRAVGWELTFDEWRGIWADSGVAALRGRGKGKYCMARHGDRGPYATGNVSIQPNEQNGFDAAKLTRAGWVRNGNPPKGWVYVKAVPARPYQVCVAKKYIGNFATQAEAEAAYMAEITRRGYIQSADNLCIQRQHQLRRSSALRTEPPVPLPASPNPAPAR